MLTRGKMTKGLQKQICHIILHVLATSGFFLWIVTLNTCMSTDLENVTHCVKKTITFGEVNLQLSLWLSVLCFKTSNAYSDSN